MDPFHFLTFQFVSKLLKKINIIAANMFMKTIILPFRIFQTFSLCPFGLHNKPLLPVSKTYLRNIAIAAIVIYTALFIHGLFITDKYINYSQKPFQYYFDFFYMTLSRLLLLIILVESLLKRNLNIKFFENIHKADTILVEKLSANLAFDQNRKLNNLRTGVWLVVFIITSGTTLICWIVSNDQLSIMYWALLLVPSLMATMRYFQMITYVNLTKIRFQVINKLVKSFYSLDPINSKKGNVVDKNLLHTMSKISDDRSAEVEKYVIFKNLIELRQVYILLYDATEMINELFRWSVPINIAKDFIDTLTCVYWTFLWILKPSMPTMHMTVASIAIIVIHMFHIMSVSNECHYTVEEVSVGYSI